MKTRLRTPELIRELGGPTAVQTRLAKRGYLISLKAVNAWVARRNVPGNWLGALAQLAREDGWALRLEDYTEPVPSEEEDPWLG